MTAWQIIRLLLDSGRTHAGFHPPCATFVHPCTADSGSEAGMTVGRAGMTKKSLSCAPYQRRLAGIMLALNRYQQPI